MENNEKCPLCGGAFVSGKCTECGYSLDEKAELDFNTGLMDTEPDSYPAEPTESEIKEAEEQKAAEAEKKYLENRSREIMVEQMFSDSKRKSRNEKYVIMSAFAVVFVPAGLIVLIFMIINMLIR